MNVEVLRNYCMSLLCECAVILCGPFAKFMDSPYYPELKLRGAAVMVSYFFLITSLDK